MIASPTLTVSVTSTKGKIISFVSKILVEWLIDKMRKNRKGMIGYGVGATEAQVEERIRQAFAEIDDDIEQGRV